LNVCSAANPPNKKNRENPPSPTTRRMAERPFSFHSRSQLKFSLHNGSSKPSVPLPDKSFFFSPVFFGHPPIFPAVRTFPWQVFSPGSFPFFEHRNSHSPGQQGPDHNVIGDPIRGFFPNNLLFQAHDTFRRNFVFLPVGRPPLAVFLFEIFLRLDGFVGVGTRPAPRCIVSPLPAFLVPQTKSGLFHLSYS